MALFGKKKEEKNAESIKTTETPQAKQPQINLAQPNNRNLENVIIRPRVTEKAVGLNGQNIYTFEVHSRATKFDVRDAIIATYSVTPVRVNIIKKSPRTTMSRLRGKKVKTKGMKKAYVYLKKGDSINLV